VTEGKDKGPKFSMSGWSKKKEVLDGPGPGKYNPSSTAWSPVKYSFAGGK